MSIARVWTLTGKPTEQTITVRIRPGFGVQIDGAHVDAGSGPVTLPADIAHALLSTSRAERVEAPIETREPIPLETREAR